MDYQIKNFKITKIKKYFKTNDFFFIFHSYKLDLNEWRKTEQKLNQLKLNYYKPLNKLTFYCLKNSIYQNFSYTIGGFIIFVNFKYKTTELNFEYLVKTLKPSFVLISIKLNNKIYFLQQLKGLKSLSYKKNIFNLYKVLDKYLKTSYMLTNNKKSRNNVI